MIDFTLILAAGVASGTILLFAAIGEIFAERSGILNLGVEGMMLMGAVAGFAVAASTGNPWVGLVIAMLAGAVLSVIHAVVTIHLRAEQVISGLALTFLGSGVARVMPASFRAIVLANAMWPSRRWMNTGWSPAASSINCRVGRRAGVQFS